MSGESKGRGVRQGTVLTPPSEQVLRRASELFHEIVSAFASKDLLAGCRNDGVAEKLKTNLRTRDQIRRIAADGFELCVLALAQVGAPDVTVHSCGDQVLGEQPWGGGDDD